MASQIAADDRGIYAPVVEKAPASPPREAARPTLTQPDHTQQAAPTSAPAATQQATAAQDVTDNAAVPATVPMRGLELALAGGVAVGLTALFTAGLVRRRAMPAIRYMAAGALETRVPLWLPLALVDIGREILYYRSAAAAAKAVSQPER